MLAPVVSPPLLVVHGMRLCQTTDLLEVQTRLLLQHQHEPAAAACARTTPFVQPTHTRNHILQALHRASRLTDGRSAAERLSELWGRLQTSCVETLAQRVAFPVVIRGWDRRDLTLVRVQDVGGE